MSLSALPFSLSAERLGLSTFQDEPFRPRLLSSLRTVPTSSKVRVLPCPAAPRRPSVSNSLLPIQAAALDKASQRDPKPQTQQDPKRPAKPDQRVIDELTAKLAQEMSLSVLSRLTRWLKPGESKPPIEIMMPGPSRIQHSHLRSEVLGAGATPEQASTARKLVALDVLAHLRHSVQLRGRAGDHGSLRGGDARVTYSLKLRGGGSGKKTLSIRCECIVMRATYVPQRDVSRAAPVDATLSATIAVGENGSWKVSRVNTTAVRSTRN